MNGYREKVTQAMARLGERREIYHENMLDSLQKDIDLSEESESSSIQDFLERLNGCRDEAE